MVPYIACFYRVVNCEVLRVRDDLRGAGENGPVKSSSEPAPSGVYIEKVLD